MKKMVLLYITNPNVELARKISHHLIEKKLIACANIFPIESIYPWQGEIQQDNEIILICKTLKQLQKIIIDEIETLHSYKTPCIIAIECESNPKFTDFIEAHVNLIASKK